MSIRAFRPILRASAASLRAAAPAPRALAIRPAVNFARTFASTSRRMGSGESDSAVSQSLAAEIEYEKEAAQAAPEQPEFIQSFKEHGVWTIEDIPGTDNYSLTRKFGNETLKLTFQVSDLEEGNEPDPEIERPDGAEEFDQPPFISGSLSITKPATPGSLLVDLEAGEEGFVITNVALFEKSVAEAEGPEGDYNRRSKYMGPQFEHLDIELQENFNAYLAERGIDETLSSFVLQYCEFKEQKDYVSWLKDVKGFVDA